MEYETMTEKELDAAIKVIGTQERGVAYNEPRIFASIHTDRWWLTLRGAEETVDKRDVLTGRILAGVILRNLYTKESKFPLCVSMDGGLTGTVNEEWTDAPIRTGQRCAECPFNQWGSARGWSMGNDPSGESNAKAGRGKACKERRALVMSVEGISEPVIVRLPTSSIGAWDAYANTLSLRGDSYLARRTAITIKVEQQGTNLYGVAQFAAMEKLSRVDLIDSLNQRKASMPLLSAGMVVAPNADEDAAGLDASVSADDANEIVDILPSAPF